MLAKQGKAVVGRHSGFDFVLFAVSILFALQYSMHFETVLHVLATYLVFFN